MNDTILFQWQMKKTKQVFIKLIIAIACICIFYVPCIAQDDCATNNFGHFCFTNRMNEKIVVNIVPSGADPGTSLILAPNGTQCIYQRKAGIYKYSANRDISQIIDKGWENLSLNISSGEMLIEKCKSKTLTLNADGGSNITDVKTINEKKTTSITKQNTERDEIREEESVSRGSGDPLKGLNVSKAKEMVIGKYYALIIGIDNYKGTWQPLNNAVNDAKAVEALFREEYKFDYFKTLYNETATRNNIISEIEWLAKNVKGNDNVLIYYSGHGEYKKEFEKGYWVPSDATSNSVSNFISNNDLQSFLVGIKSKHTLLISDACFSGDVMRGNTITISFENSDKYYNKTYELKSRKAITSGSIEPVMDGGKNGHSVFTYYLLQVLSKNQEKYFDAGQLYEQIKVPIINNSEQSPQFSAIKNTGDEGGQFIFIKK